MRRQLLGLSVAVAAAWVTPAHAYNNREHQRLPDQAIQIANILRRGAHLTSKVSALTGQSAVSLTVRPSSVPATDQALWDRFIQEAKELPDRMGQVRTGLPDPRVAGNRCGDQYPVLPAGTHLAQCKARDLPFAVKRGWASNTSDCFIRGNYFAGDPNVAEFFNSLPSDDTGALLGYYAQAVDDEVNDSIWWFSTQNAGFLSTVKAVVNDATEFGLAIALAPFACLFSLFSGDNCFDKARDWAHQTNPVTKADQLGKDFEKSIDPFRMDGDDLFSTTGVWHFINVEDGPNGDFNRIAGMHYTHGGWRGGPNFLGVGRIDALDFGIIIGGDATGMTIDPDQANGVSRYQQSPDGPINRTRDDWYAGIAHTEFEPLDNLALYGWRRFQSGHDASGLGWVLHALGDAVAPHHGIAATGWGHRPFEDFAGFGWGEMFSEGKPQHYFLMSDILAQAFGWWRLLDANSSDIAVRDLITELALTTRGVSDYALKNGISVGYSDGDESRARELYGSTSSQTLGLLKSGTAATLAFLVKASRLIAADSSPSPCACPNGQGRSKGLCVPCTTLDEVEVNGRCVPVCPTDLPLLDQNGHCVATCPAGSTCTGAACAPGQLVQNGVCVGTCSSATPFILDHECLAGCPPNTIVVPDPSSGGSGPFFCEQSFCNTGVNTGDSEQVCCPADRPFINGTTCVAFCPFEASFFVHATGAPSQCVTSCPASGFRYFVPGEGPHECTTQCPTSRPFGVPTSGGQSCQVACTASLPFHMPQFTAGQTVDCLAACPALTPFHDMSQSCLAVCPTSTPFHEVNGLCVASCPFGANVDGTCLSGPGPE